MCAIRKDSFSVVLFRNMSFLTNSERNEIRAMEGELFDTFKEEILLYKAPTKTFLVKTQGASDFNFAYGAELEADNPNVTYVPASGTFWATIEYVDQQDNQQTEFANNSNPVLPKGIVKVCVSGTTAKDFMSASEKIFFDGENFTILSDIRPRGMFERQYYEFWLQKFQ